ncbi:Coenzyme F420 hydrogenase/dehydrogenase, beta subunit C-terminal domain [Collinsella tanakaei]|nr:Coenzyme F420 hydrogenase/dehydrogenase, beta subunit C-terminal domain [Collinsella tanakaei]
MLTICEEKKCAGCMACAGICPTGAVSIEPGIDFYRPVIDQDKCIDCGRCTKVCQQLHPAEFREPATWYQGWTEDPAERGASSSGGFATAISRAFARSGGAVCACTFSQGCFGFEVVDDPDKVARFRGSKYVKSDPSAVYVQVRDLLKTGCKVLFIGLPCQVSAMRNFVGEGLEEHLYTVDLICHGTPSPQLLDKFLRERGYELENLEDIAFRRKAWFQLRDGAVTIDEPGVVDRYLVAFLEGLDYTENCYSCVYARRKRVSDLTLGDSWGTELIEEAGNGVSLALCQTPKGEELLREAGLKLLAVDEERAAANNKQLNRPMGRPAARERFMRDCSAGVPFERAVKRALPKQCRRQDVKRVLARLGLRKPGGGIK